MIYRVILVHVFIEIKEGKTYHDFQSDLYGIAD